MRIILLSVQIAVIMLMTFITVAAGGGLASTLALGGGVGPAAAAAGVYILMIFAAAVVGFVAFVLPTAILAAVTLVFAVLSGYRYLRWTRFLGIMANLAGAAYCLLPLLWDQDFPLVILAIFLLYPGFNIALFLVLPRRPNIRLTRTLSYVAIPVLYAFAPILAILVLVTRPPSFTALQYLILLVFLAIYTFPFYFVLRTIPHTQSPTPRLLVRLAISCLMAAAALFVIFPLGLPLGISTFLVLALTEISLLYPDAPPPHGGFRFRIARTLGRLPDTTDTAVLPALRTTAASALNSDLGRGAMEQAKSVWLRAAAYLERIAGGEKIEESAGKDESRKYDHGEHIE